MQGSSEVAECVLFATGRTPVTGLLELDKAGVATDQRGFIKVDQNGECAAPAATVLSRAFSSTGTRLRVGCGGAGGLTHRARPAAVARRGDQRGWDLRGG
jgi:hypothetical protein